MAKKILVVDDEENMVEMIKDRLEANGYEIITAYDGLQALRKANLEAPDLMVLDVMMPKLDGFSLAKMLRDDELLHNKQHLPILMLTARTGDKEETAGFAAGTNVYLKKPFEPQQLLAEIKKLLGE
ncbi:MAG: response regulator [bacterium]|nr:response regulator [Candidatus Margulisiibacteriota bacterium]